MLASPSPLTRSTKALEIVSLVSLTNKASTPSGEETWQTSLDISQLKPLTSRSRTSTKRFSTHTTPRRTQSNSSSEIACQVEQPVLPPSASFTHSISLEPDSPLMLAPENNVSSMDLLTASRRSLFQMVLKVFTEVLVFQLLVSLLTELHTSVASTLVKPFSSQTLRMPQWLPCGCSLKSSQ